MSEDIKLSNVFTYKKDNNPKEIIFTIEESYNNLNDSWKEHFLTQLNRWILKEFKTLKNE